MHHNIWQMLLVPALLSKNSRFIKNTTTKNGYQAGFLSVIASKWKYICIYSEVWNVCLPHYNRRIDILYGVIVKEYRIISTLKASKGIPKWGQYISL